MAISFLTAPEKLLPAYSKNHIFRLYDSDLSTLTNTYYNLIIYPTNDVSVAIKNLPDLNGEGYYDVGHILQSYFTSTIITNDSSLLLDNSSGLLTYQVKGQAINGSTVHSVDSSMYYAFNGVDRFNQIDMSTYMFGNNDVSSNFLTTWDTKRYVHLTDDCYLQFFGGKFNTIDCSFNGLTISKYKKSGVVDVSTLTRTVPVTAKIWSLNVGPKYLNTLGVNITSEVDYYTITERKGLTKVYRFDVYPEDNRFERYFRLFYVNSLGATDAMNFDLRYENDIKIKSDTYTNNYIKNQVNTSVEDIYNIRSLWMEESVSKALKELWHSPRVGLKETLGIEPIILEETSKNILHRKQNTYLNYECTFSYADKYKVQFN